MLAAVCSAPQAQHMVRTAWGQFAFRRHDMQAADGARAVALRVSRMAAEPLRMAQGAAALGLSPQQREVAVLMAGGHSNAEIAEHLGITKNTASNYKRKIHALIASKSK